jgi:hypothetical protein
MSETTERAEVIQMPARERRDVDGSNATGEPASVKLLPGVVPGDPALIDSMCEDQMKHFCALFLMYIRAQSDKLNSLFQALPEQLRASALIELVLSQALKECEVRAILYGLMTNLNPEWIRMLEDCADDGQTDDETGLTDEPYECGKRAEGAAVLEDA